MKKTATGIVGRRNSGGMVSRTPQKPRMRPALNVGNRTLAGIGGTIFRRAGPVSRGGFHASIATPGTPVDPGCPGEDAPGGGAAP